MMQKHNVQYVQVVLPLAVAGSFTYTLPPEFAEKVQVGSRVVVQFGTRRYYTGIVLDVLTENPSPQSKLKSIADVVDNAPILLTEQLKLWQWIATYYMCTLGEVMKAALPSGLKLESETILLRNADFEAEGAELSDRDHAILHALNDEKGHDILALEKALGIKALIRPVRRLMEMGAIVVRETLAQSFKPRTEQFVRLSETLQTETALHQAIDTLKRAPAQEALFMRYLELAEATAAFKLQNPKLLKAVSRHELCSEPNAATALTALKKRGLMETYAVETSRLLSTEQQRAHDEIVNIFAQKNVCLLHGVTSSGKTEVYIQLIRETLAQGKQVLYLVPEIALTTQLTTRLARVFGKQMGVYHSKFPDAERVELWKHQLSAQAYPLILGVRSSLFLPFQNLGLVIVDEEHETSYKQVDPAPRYNARDTAILMAAQQKAKVLLGTVAFRQYSNVAPADGLIAAHAAM